MHFTSGVCTILATVNFLVLWCIDQPPLTHIVCTTRLKFFGRAARAEVSIDHSQAFGSSVALLPRDWNHKSGQLHHSWLQTVESNLTPINIILATACSRAQNRQACTTLISIVHWMSHTLMITRSIWKMLGPFATASRRTLIHQVSLLLHASYSYSAGGVRCPRQQQRQRVTEGTAMAP